MAYCRFQTGVVYYSGESDSPGRMSGRVDQGEGKVRKWLVSAVEKGVAPVPVLEERFLSFIEDIFCCVRISV